jgi:hypothetical protein
VGGKAVPAGVVADPAGAGVKVGGTFGGRAVASLGTMDRKETRYAAKLSSWSWRSGPPNCALHGAMAMACGSLAVRAPGYVSGRVDSGRPAAITEAKYS